MGFHPTDVWQFWQGILRLPCGLRETDCGRFWPGLSAEVPHSSAHSTATANRNLANEPQSPKGVPPSSQTEMQFWGHVSAALDAQ